MQTRVSHSSHWGAFDAVVEGGSITQVVPWSGDQHPSPLLANIPGSTNHRARVAQPYVRAGWLKNGAGPSDLRGRDEMIPVGWDEVTELVANELERVIEMHGNRAIYGGSYGWSSAGRFHHAQGQMHRFLNVLGGYVYSVNTYSNAAGEVILDRVGGGMRTHFLKPTTWDVVAEHTDLFIAFGGLPLKNSAVSPGGASVHSMRNQLIAAAERGCEFVYFSPLKDDLIDEVGGTWLAPVPGTDVAIMLAMSYLLIDEGLADTAFLDRYTVGFDAFAPYVLGASDGIPKTPDWAAAISGIPASTIAELARKMVRGKTMINTSWSLQRAKHGEQPPWMGLVLAALVGQIGLQGGGYGFGYASMASIGEPAPYLGAPLFPQLDNPIEDYIPVSRVSDLLLHPGETFDYDGKRLTYPDIRLVWWAGGNPFHHHQDLGRLELALGRPDTVIVNDPFWTAMSRHADIVLPSTVTLERDDIGASSTDSLLVAMQAGVAPYGESKNDYAIYSAIAARLGREQAFTEGRTEAEWMRHIYDVWADFVERKWPDVPAFDEFWERGFTELPLPEKPHVMFSAFRENPDKRPLRTPSGKIEIFSETIASFGYADCAGHPTWMEPDEWLGSQETDRFPLHLVANNPKTRLHSQLDIGAGSQASKILGREPMRMHPDDAAARGIEDGAIVRVFNDRGSLLAGVMISEQVRSNVVQLSTGAWFDPLRTEDGAPFCVHGNPNVLTRDIGTSSLAQGCTGQHALVQVELWTGEIPPIRAYEPPG